MSEGLLQMAEGYEQIAAGIRKMVAAQEKTPEKEAKPVHKAEKKKENVTDTPNEEATIDIKRVRAFLTERSRKGKTSEIKHLIEQLGYEKLSDVPPEKLPELYEKAKVL